MILRENAVDWITPLTDIETLFLDFQLGGGGSEELSKEMLEAFPAEMIISYENQEGPLEVGMKGNDEWGETVICFILKLRWQPLRWKTIAQY